ncbi:hypothetical protein EGM70_10500 [Enterobacteriaceae bacterium 89]|nr:hypothetical protein [Enterobacteriaceae bacterium 89]
MLKSLKSIKWLCLSLLCWSFMAHAYDDKVCYPTAGTPAVLDYNLTKSLTKAQNTANNNMISDIDLGGTTQYTCECDDANAQMVHYFSASSPLPTVMIGNSKYFAITKNLWARVQIYIDSPSPNNYYEVPFTGIANQWTEPCSRTGNDAAARKARVSLYVVHPMISGAEYHGTIARVWHYRKPGYINEADPVETVVNFDINLTVPDKCTLLPGSVLNVDLGSLRPHQFKGKAYSEVPDSYTPKNFNLKFSCTISNATLNVDLIGNEDAHNQGFATNKPNISVIIKDKDGNIIPPDGRAGSVTIDANKNSSTLVLNAYPTTDGVIPSLGEFSTTATILMSYQ